MLLRIGLISMVVGTLNRTIRKAGDYNPADPG